MWKGVRYWGVWVQLIRKLGIQGELCGWTGTSELKGGDSKREHGRPHLANGRRLLVACANTVGAVGRERWEEVVPGSVTGRRAAMSPVYRRAGSSRSHRQQYRIAWKYLLIKGCKTSESVFTA